MNYSMINIENQYLKLSSTQTSLLGIGKITWFGTSHNQSQWPFSSNSSPIISRSKQIVAALHQKTPFLDKAFGKFPTTRVPWVRPYQHSGILSVFLTHHAGENVSSKLFICKQMLCSNGIVSHLRRRDEVNPIWIWDGLLESGSP